MTVFGYCRISTTKQSIDRQIRNIRAEYPAAIIIQEAYTGTKMDRPQWQRLLKRVKAGDTIVFDSVSRMSRDAEEGFQIYEELFAKGVDLVFLKEHHIDTRTYKNAIDRQVQLNVSTGDEKTDDFIQSISNALNTYLLELAKEQIRIAFEQAEKEVTDLRQRTREGIETARLNGKRIGNQKGSELHVKKKEPAMEKIQRYSRDFDGVLPDSEVLKITGLSRNTYYKYKKELKAVKDA